MSIRINWEISANQSTFSKYRVFRSTEKETLYDGEPIMEISDINTLEYTDSTAVEQTLYWYGVQIIASDGLYSSRPLPFSSNPYSGEGNASIIRGDSSFGFMGEGSPNLYNLANAKVTEFLISKGVTIAACVPKFINGGKNTFNKFIYNGKIIYVPFAYQNYCASNMTNQAAYDLFVKPLIDDPLTITFDGHCYEIMVLDREQTYDLHMSQSTCITNHFKRMSVVQGFEQVNGFSGGYFKVSPQGYMSFFTKPPFSPANGFLVEYTLSQPSGAARGPVIWGLVPRAPL